MPDNRRTNLRHFATGLICLALGVIVNLLIALSINVDARAIAAGIRMNATAQPEDRPWLLWMPSTAPPPTWELRGYNSELDFEFQSTVEPGTHVPDPDGFWWWEPDSPESDQDAPCAWGLCIVRSGWPMRCLTSAYRWMEIDCEGEYPLAVRRPVQLLPPGVDGAIERRLPTRPLVLGFTLNSILYALAVLPAWLLGRWVIERTRAMRSELERGEERA